MASSVHGSITSEDEEPRRICNLDWDSDYEAHRFGPSWESYPMSPNDDDEGPCRHCLSDADEEPHFRVQLLHGSLTLPLSSHPSMDSSLWSRLPPHLLERALVMVPLAFSFRLALVCKSWLSLLSSPHFKKLRFELAISGRVGLSASLWYGQGTECNAESPSGGTWDWKKSDVVSSGDGGNREVNGSADASDSSFLGDDKACLSGSSELNAGRRLSKKLGKSSTSLQTFILDGANEFLCPITEQSGHGSAIPSTTGIDDVEADMEEEFFFPGMPDAVCALEYQPGRLCPGCQPRMSDISYFDKGKMYKIYLSFLPEKFRFFLPPDCVVQDGFVCLFKAESFASPNSTGGCDQMKRLCFCVANPITKSWKELPSEVCPRSEFKKWRED